MKLSPCLTDQDIIIRAISDLNTNQQGLASMMGVSLATLHRWAKGRAIEQRKLTFLALASVYVLRLGNSDISTSRFTELASLAKEL